MNRASMCIIAVLAVLAAPAWAQSKIGFIDSNRTVVSTDEGKAEYQKIMDWAKAQDDQVRSRARLMEEKQNQLRSQQNVLTDTRRDELIGEIDALDTEIKRRSEDLKKAFNQRIEDFTKRMNAKMAPLFQKFAQDNHYAAILYLNPQVIAYLNPGADVTDTVIALYNQTYPAAAAPAAPATPAKK